MELDPVVETFEARVGPYLAGIEAAMDATRDFRDEVLAAVAAIEALDAALDTLDGRTVRVHVETTGLAGALAAGAAVPAAGGVPEAGAWDAQAASLHLAQEAAYADAAAQEAAAAAQEHAAGTAAFEAMALRELRDISASLDTVASALGESQQHLAVIQRDAADASADLMMQTAMLRAAQDAAGPSIVRVDNSTRNYNRTLVSSAQAADGARRYLGLLPLTWTAIHWAVTGTAEALAVIIPAMVAAGSAGAVGLQGAVDVADRLRATYTATEATASYLGKTISTGLGQGINQFTQNAGQAANAGSHLHDMLQQAQDAAQPHVYELLGAAIDGASGKFGVFNQIGGQTIGMLDQFAAKIDIGLRGPLGNLGQQVSANAVPDLRMLGQVVGNVGHAVAYAAGQMPGMAGLLLHVLDAGTQVLDWALHFQGVMETVFLAHEAYMWGRLTANALSGVAGALANAAPALGAFAGKLLGEGEAADSAGMALSGMGASLESTAAFLGGPWGIALGAGAIGLTLLIAKLGGAKDATEQWISSLENTVAQARGLQQIADTYSALQQVTAALAASNRALAPQMAQAAQQQAAAAGVATRYVSGYSGALQRAAQDNQDLSSAQQALAGDFRTEISNVRYLSGEYRIGYTEAAQLAADAGVSLTTSLKGNSVAAQEARQMITNLIAGYGGMAAVGSELGQDINAVSFAAAIQNGNVAKLNQAWDTFISTVQAPSSTFLAFAQSLAQFGKDAKTAGASMSGLGGAMATAGTHVNTAAVQLQQDFNSSVSSAQQMLDSMRTVAAITGQGGPLVAGIKDAVQVLIPLAGANEGARAQIFALAQEAGGPASGSLRALAHWAGSTKDPLAALYSLSMQASGAIQKLGADTQALAATMQASLNQTLVTQALTLTHVDQKTAVYLHDLQKYGPASAITQTALDNMNSAQSQANTLATEGASASSLLNGKVRQQGQAMAGTHGARQQLVQDIQGILDRAPNASADIGSLMNAVEHGGTTTQAYHGARQQLISDLEHAGLKAQQATILVDELIRAIEGIPPSKTVTIHVSTLYTSATASAAGAAYASGGAGHAVYGPVYGAAGMRVPGHGHGDIVPAMLEPGEAVVPRHLVHAVAPFLAAHHVPGFASGGYLPAGRSAGAEAGGGAPVHSTRPIIIRTELDGQVLAEQLVPGLVAAVADYNYGNTGRPTGKLIPGR